MLEALNLRNLILGIGLFATVIAVYLFAHPTNKSGPQGDVVLWGTLPENEMNNVTQVFNPQAKSYAVRYKYVPEATFNQQLLEALASGTGPDMIITPYQMILSQASRIYPFPVASFPEKNFKDSYVDGATVLFTPQGALALPVSVDPMVLFYNRSLLSKHGIVNPPAYWDEVGTITPTLTIESKNGFVESAIALGTPDVPYAKDIIMSIVAQLGQAPVVRIPASNGDYYINVVANEPVTEGNVVLPLTTTASFFTQFGDPGQKNYTWNSSLGDARDAFIAEKLAMYIGYAGELSLLRVSNPRANIEMTYLPQTRGYNTFAMGMKMYAIATLKSSKNLTASFAVESQFASPGVSPAVAAIVGAVPALRSYAGTQGLDPVVARSMLVARGWYDPYYEQSNAYILTMISDIINYRYGVSDAVNIFVARLRDVYTKH